MTGWQEPMIALAWNCQYYLSTNSHCLTELFSRIATNCQLASSFLYSFILKRKDVESTELQFDITCTDAVVNDVAVCFPDPQSTSLPPFLADSVDFIHQSQDLSLHLLARRDPWRDCLRKWGSNMGLLKQVFVSWLLGPWQTKKCKSQQALRAVLGSWSW